MASVQVYLFNILIIYGKDPNYKMCCVYIASNYNQINAS